jgi:hypothetical protein
MVLTISNPGRAASRLAFAAALWFAAAAVAQKYEPPPPPIVCVPTKKDPCTPPPAPATPPPAETFPFPGEPGEPAAQTPGQTPAQTQTQTPPAEGNPFPGEPGDAKPVAPASAADKFPFPGEPDETKPAAPAGQTPSAPTPASGAADKFPFPGEPTSTGESSSSSSSSSSSGDTDSAPDADAANSGGKPLTRSQRRMLPKVEDLDHRELEDLDISKYYISTGNFKAAYLRAQDAVKTIPDDPDAHYALALAAERMKLNDEAVKEYRNYLAADPDGINAKKAQKALAALAPKQ